MNLNRSTMSLFLFGILCNLLIRYPTFAFESGSDSFGNHVISQQIIDTGDDSRFLNSLSYFGLFPFSNNMGSAFFLSAFSMVSDIPILYSILYVSILISIFSYSSMIMLYRLFDYSPNDAIIAGILYTTARYMLAFTEWTYSYRGQLMALMPMFFYLSFKVFSGRNPLYFLLCVFLLFSLLAIHHAAILTGLLLPSLITVKILQYLTSHLTSFRTFFYKTKVTDFILLSIPLIVSVLTFYNEYYEGASEGSKALGAEYFFDRSGVFTFINILLLYAMAFGFLTIFIIPGFLSIAPLIKTSLYSGSNNSYLLLYCFLLFYTFIWPDTVYSVMIVLPFMALFATVGINKTQVYFFGEGPSSKKFISVIVVVILCQFSPEKITITESSYDYIRPSDNFYSRNGEIVAASNAGLYLGSHELNYQLYGVTVSASKIAAFSDTRLNHSYPPSTLELFEYRFVGWDKLLTGRVDLLYVIDSEDKRDLPSMYHSVLRSGRDSQDIMVEKNINTIYSDDTLLVVLYTRYPTLSVDVITNEWIESVFLQSILEYNYRIYNSDFHQIHYLSYD